MARTFGPSLIAIMLCISMAYADVDVQPAPASIGSDVPLTYFGPAPSSVDPKLVGPVTLLKSGTIDSNKGTITLPLYYGYSKRSSSSPAIPYFFILTDTTDYNVAGALGVNPSQKLKYAIQPGAYRTGRLDAQNILVTNQGYVDFSPVHSIVAGDAPNYFPPKTFTPGSVGMDGYSPIVVLGGDVYNMPTVADGRDMSKLKNLCNLEKQTPAQQANARKYVHDKVVNLCLNEAGTGGTVTLILTTGFSFGKPVLYLSTDANLPLPSAVEAVTYAPSLGNITVGGDDSLFSAVERLFTTTNGYTNADVNPTKMKGGPGEKVHPLRQGLSSALHGDGFPLNVLGGIPTVATDYSPLWDLNVGSWTAYAIANNYRTRILDEFTYLGFVEKGFITGPGGAQFSSSGFIVNCPPALRFL